MKRLALTLVACHLLFGSSALADTGPLWGYIVYDADDDFVTGEWPRSPTATFGSDEDADVVLTGLEKEHATIRIEGDEIVVEPKGPVWIGDAAIEAPAHVSPDAAIRIGDYRVKVILRDETYEEGPNDPVKAGEGTPLEESILSELEGTDAKTAPGLEEAAARAAIARTPEYDGYGYRFCHDENYGEGGVVGADFCAIFDESSREVCPAVAETCPWTELEAEAIFGDARGGRDGKGKGQGKKRIRKRRRPVTLPAVPPVVAYLVLGGLVLILVLWFIKQLSDAGWEKSELDLAEEEIDEAALDLQSLPEARSHVLLKLADRALARGEVEEAAILMHLSLLRHLDDEGLARYHPSKTNGDYLRSIRRLKPLSALFRGVANETERVRFGDGHVDEARVRELLVEARSLLVPGSERPSSVGTAAGGAASLGLLMLMSVGLQGCPELDDTQAFYSHGPAGLSALPRMLRDAGFSPQVKLEPLAKVPYDVQTIVFRTSATKTGELPSDLGLDELLDRGASVVVLDDLHQASHFLPHTATITGALDAGMSVDAVQLAMPMPEESGACHTRLAGLQELLDRDPVKIPRGRRISWTGEPGIAKVSNDPLSLEPLLVYKDDPGSVNNAVAFSVQRHRADGALSGCLYVFSDRDLFTNASLTRRANARFVGALFSALAQDNGKIWIVERLERWESGSGGGDDDGGPDPTKPLRASNLLPLLLQSLVSLAILYVFLGAAFGPLRDPVHTHHKAFVEHVEAIGRQYARCGIAGLNHAAASLARLVVMRNRERIRSGGSGWGVVARELAEKHDLPEQDVRAALRLGIEGTSELGTPKLEDPAPSSERMLRTLSRLLGGRHAELALKQRRGFRRGSKSRRVT